MDSSVNDALLNEAGHLVGVMREYRRLCALHGSERIELEIRLGLLTELPERRFHAGVPKDTYDQIESEMLETASLRADGTYKEMVDYHYADPSGRRIRTRVVFDTDEIDIKKEHVCKQVVMSAIAVCETDTKECARISLCVENLVTNPPDSCLPNHVRTKQRRCFRRCENEHVTWSYELSRTWSGNSRTSVEHKQNMCEPCYEVECELQDDSGHYLDSHSDMYMAHSLLIKVQALLGLPHNSCVDIQLDRVGRSSCKKRRSRRRCDESAHPKSRCARADSQSTDV